MRLLRLSPNAYRHVTLVATVLLGVIIVTGGAVRLSGSGLGCSDWPNCEPGSLVPREASDLNAMIEFLNRVFTVLVSVAVIVCVLGSLVRVPRRRDLVWLSFGLVAGVFSQAVLGGLTVLFELQPPLVMAHFLLSLVLLTNALVLYRRASEPPGVGRSLVEHRVRVLDRVLLVVATVVVTTGTVVTATGPHGGDRKAKRFEFDLPVVARIHGTSVVIFLALVLATFWVLRRTRAPEAVQRRLGFLLVVLVAQAIIGYVQYLNNIPELLVGFHLAGATAVWAAVVWYSLGLTVRDGPAEDSASGAPEPVLSRA
ncbi:MAG: COX15/CtaA family protein [Acidimicrobiia bacterium]|nr:COX15/CtaA family protein [Acidimicrobiia bacterium]